jgi:hypothetical protein
MCGCGAAAVATAQLSSLDDRYRYRYRSIWRNGDDQRRQIVRKYAARTPAITRPATADDASDFMWFDE